MATSKKFPAIPTPRTVEGDPGLRAIQQAIDNIRQRIEAAEAATTTGASVEQFNTTITQIGALRTQLGALAGRVRVLEQASAVDTLTLAAAESITQFAPVVALSSTTCGLADPSDPLRMFAVLGLATNGGTLGKAIVIQRRGPLQVPGAVFDVDRAVYVQHGGLTQTPNYEATAIPVGVAIAADTVWIAPDWPALLHRPFASAVGDAYLRYLSVTYDLMRDAANLLPLSGLSFTSGLDGTELMFVERGGVQFQVTVRDIASFVP